MEINSTNASINFNGYKTSFSKKFENFMKNDAISAEKISDLQNSMKKVISQKMAPKYYMGEGRSNKDFVELSKKTDGYRCHFDCNNPNNFVKVGKQIKIVDDISESFHTPDCYDMVKVFMKDYNLPTSKNTKKMKRAILQKCIIASSKAGLELNPNKMRVELAQLYPSEFLSDFNGNLQTINKLPKSEKELQFKIYFKELDKQ